MIRCARARPSPTCSAARTFRNDRQECLPLSLSCSPAAARLRASTVSLTLGLCLECLLDVLRVNTHFGPLRQPIFLRQPNKGIRQKRGWYRVKSEDHPKKMPFRTAQLLRRAGHAGTQVGVLCVAIYQRQGEVGIRRILGILSLAKKYGTAALEDACAAAIEIGVPEYRFVRRYLERRPQLTLRQVDPLIRELTEYRDFINLKLKEQAE